MTITASPAGPDTKSPVATLKFSIDCDHIPERAEVVALMDAAKKVGTPRDAKLSIPRQIISDVPTD